MSGEIERRKEKRIAVNRGVSATRIEKNFQVAKIVNISSQGMAIEIKTKRNLKDKGIEMDILISDSSLSLYLTKLCGNIVSEHDCLSDRNNDYSGPLKQCSIIFGGISREKKQLLKNFINDGS